MEAARYDEFWEELQKALGSVQWSRRLVVPSPGSPKAKETKPAKPTIKKEHHHDGDSSHKQEQEHFLLLDLPSRTFSLLTTTSSSPKEGGREGGFYSLVLDPSTLQACQEEIMEYNSMADFAAEFAEALQGIKTVEIKLGGGGGGGGACSTAPAAVELTFNKQQDETMSISLPCLQEGGCTALLPVLRPFFHFDAATGIGGQPAEVEGGREGGVKAAAVTTGAVAAAGQKRPKSEGGGGGGQRIVQSLIHPGLAVRSTVTGSKWEDEDEREDEGRKRKKGEGAEESKKKGKDGVKRE